MPSDADRAGWRGLFSRGDPSAPPRRGQPQTLDDRLEEGIQEMQRSAVSLMREVAAEVWRAAGGDKDQAGAKILEALSRDQAIRSLVAHSDDRFQDLAVRTARLEDSITSLAEDTRAARAALSDSVRALEDAVGAPAVRGYEELRGQLQEVTQNVASAFKTLADRDRLIVQTVTEQVREHGELISRETGHVARSMQSYVQEGVNALGLLAGHMDAQIEAQAAREGEAGPIPDAVEGLLDQHLDLVNERLGITARDIEASIGAAARAVQDIDRHIDTQVAGLARLVRSDSEVLRQEVVRAAEATDEQVARTLDEQLGRVSDALTTATRWAVEEMTRRFREETARAVQAQLQDAAVTVGRASTEAIDAAISGRFETAVDRLTAAAQGAQHAGREDEQRLAQEVEDRITALGRMIRSDNQALASRMQVAVEQQAAKQALRAVKEMHASLPNEIQEVVDGRVQAMAQQLHAEVQSTADAVAKLSEALQRKFDEATARMSERHDQELQDVMGRMGDAMHALASLGRPSRERIEVD